MNCGSIWRKKRSIGWLVGPSNYEKEANGKCLHSGLPEVCWLIQLTPFGLWDIKK
jgi:hypothetical protein